MKWGSLNLGDPQYLPSAFTALFTRVLPGYFMSEFGFKMVSLVTGRFPSSVSSLPPQLNLGGSLVPEVKQFSHDSRVS